MHHGGSATQTSSFTVPATQNTAPVHEFNCLYTHDIKRKTKRWQDGFLRFHTFNKRIMVYDVPRNFVGDTHWTVDEPLCDGDEVTLDRCGVLVQVADQVGKTETDLTDIKRAKSGRTVPIGSSAKGIPTGGVATAIQHVSLHPRSSLMQVSQRRAPLQEKHRSLNSLLGADRSVVGKAVPCTESPFEARRRHELATAHDTDDFLVSSRPTKRLKPTRSAHTTQKPVVDAVLKHKHKSAQPKPRSEAITPTVIDLSSDEPTPVTGICADLESIPSLFDKIVQQPNRLNTVQRPAFEQSAGTRLTIKPTAAKRRMLSCVTELESNTSRDSPTLLAQEQEKLTARLAKLHKRAGGRKRADDQLFQPVDLTDTKAQPGFSAPKTPRQYPSRTIQQSAKVIELDNPGSERALKSDTARLPDKRLRPDGGAGELYDLFGTAIENVADLQRTSHDAAGRHDEHLAANDSKCAVDPRTPSNDAFDVPSTFDMEAALQLCPSLLDHGDEVMQGDAHETDDHNRTEESAQDQDLLAPAKAIMPDRGVAQQQVPWSREAFDLFDWRPPGWDEEQWCIPVS